MIKRVLSIAGALALASALASPALAKDDKQHVGSVQICTGGSDGNYAKVGHMLQEQLKQMGVPSEVNFTQGSVQNLSLMMNERTSEPGAPPWCDVALTQNDALRNFYVERAGAKERIARMEALYTEKVHFLCNRDAAKQFGLSRVPDIRGKGDKLRVAVGKAQSGPNETFKSLVAADKDYDKIGKVYIAGDEALEAIADGTEAQCMIYTAGFNTGFMQKAIKNYASKIILLGFDDSDLDNSKDERGRPIYSIVDIPGGIYSGIQTRNVLLCGGSCSTKTAAVDAVMVFSRTWRDKAGDGGYSKLVAAKNNIKGEVRKQFDK